MQNISFFKRSLALLVIALVITGLGTLGLEWVKASTGGNGFTLESGDLVVESGNVGIGTTSPSTVFHVDGSASNGWAVFERADKKLYVNANWSAQNNFAQIAPAGSDSMGLSLSSNDSQPEQLFITTSGNVGIGTTTPSYKLDVNGTIRGSNVSPSDLRLKQNIQTLEDSLAKITQLRGVSFNWQDPAKGVDPQIGVIAQEVEQVFPELVSTDQKGFKSVAYDKFVGVLIETTKELKAENDKLKARISALETKHQ